MSGQAIPSAFVWRRLHSLMGLWLVLFLMEHLLTNSQAALLIGEDGGGFVRMVNLIHSLPYLPAIELTLLGGPILVHTIWGIRYLMTSAPNSGSSDGSKPSLPDYPRNKFYTLQRLTSWILAVAIVAHVVQMRFIEYPASATREGDHHYMVRLNLDPGLYTLQSRLGFQLYDSLRIDMAAGSDRVRPAVDTPGVDSIDFVTGPEPSRYDPDLARRLQQQQKQQQEYEWIEALRHKPLGEGQVMAVADNFGTAVLLTVRDTFKSPLFCLLYSLFVLAAAFHAFNGLWTFCITWGFTMTERSQELARYVTSGLTVLMAGLGLSAIWGTYWLNLFS